MSERDYYWGGSISPKLPLFGTWLKDTLELQREYFGNDLHALEGKAREIEILIQSYSATEELHEATAEVSWKPWAKSDYFNREAYIGELVDALHFIANLLCIARCTDEELTAAYMEKMERNRARQRSGYTGTDKCTGCKRAVDDIEAHGGAMLQGDTATGEQWCDSCCTSDASTGEIE